MSPWLRQKPGGPGRHEIERLNDDTPLVRSARPPSRLLGATVQVRSAGARLNALVAVCSTVALIAFGFAPLGVLAVLFDGILAAWVAHAIADLLVFFVLVGWM